MINHVRCLLFNESFSSTYYDNDEYVHKGFTAISLPAALRAVWLLLFGSDNREVKNATLAQILTIADRREDLFNIIRSFDSRITYRQPYGQFTEPANGWIAAAEEIDPTSIFRPDQDDVDDALYKIWATAPLEADRAAAVAITLAKRINEYRETIGI